MGSPPDVRVAVPADGPAIAACHGACWREAYTGRIPAAVIEARHGDLEATSRRWTERLGGPVRTWIATAGDAVLGFATAGAARDDDAPGRTELYGLYVRASWHGTGLSQRLVLAAVGDAAAYVWVLDPNPRAQRFYAKVGFRADGQVRAQEGLGGVCEIRMLRT